MINEWESKAKLQKYPELLEQYNTDWNEGLKDFRNENEVVNFKKLIKMRSPFIDKLCPSRDVRLDNLSKNYMFKKNYDSTQVKSVRCDQIMKTQGNLTKNLSKLTKRQ